MSRMRHELASDLEGRKPQACVLLLSTGRSFTRKYGIKLESIAQILWSAYRLEELPQFSHICYYYTSLPKSTNPEGTYENLVRVVRKNA